MPELPELEALARSLPESVVGREIVSVAVRSPSLLKTFSPPISALEDDSIREIRRRGKWLLFDTASRHTLAVHLMTGGRLRRTNGRPAAARADGMIVRFADATDLRLAEIGSKKQSAVHLLSGDGSDPLAHLGPDPLDADFTPARLAVALTSRPRQLKTALTDQRVVAGIGNAWGDEILHRARLSPLIMTPRLTRDQIGVLRDAIEVCIQEGIEHGLRDNYLEKLKAESRPYLRVHNRKGEPCYRCSTRLDAIWSGERNTTYCPTCQSDGKVYADRRLSRLLR